MHTKHLMTLSALLAATIAAMRIPTNNGALGDVKYSVLKPSDFERVNGPGWELLRGQRSDSTSDLCNDLGMWCNGRLPDARGRFLRAMSIGQNTQDGDPDTSRSVGTFQSDSFALHTHGVGFSPGRDMEYSTQTTFNAGAGAAGVLGTILFKGVGAYLDHGKFVDQYPNDPHRPFLERVGGSETRPKNIALYVYVRLRR